MPDIDIDKIKPGDTVRVRFQSVAMAASGIAPYEPPPLTVYDYRSYSPVLFAGGYDLYDSNVTILEHIPARPDWADALVVRDKDGDLWGRNRNATFRLIAADSGGLCLSASEVAELSPITVVLDADGNPPAAKVEWLDADALDKLPLGAVVVPQFASRSAVRGSYWHMPQSDRADKMHTSAEIAPARVLWTPDADR